MTTLNNMYLYKVRNKNFHQRVTEIELIAITSKIYKHSSTWATHCGKEFDATTANKAPYGTMYDGLATSENYLTIQGVT